MKFPQGMHANWGPEGPVLTIGDHDLSDLPISSEGPVVETMTSPGDPRPMRTAWVPIMFEGEVSDRNGMLRMVNDGQAKDVGVPVADEVAVEIARAFHEAYERLAPDHGYQTRERSAVPWDDVPADNKRLMVATVRSLLRGGVIGRVRD